MARLSIVTRCMVILSFIGLVIHFGIPTVSAAYLSDDSAKYVMNIQQSSPVGSDY